jgi:acetolactate synthase I/III small subunit
MENKLYTFSIFTENFPGLLLRVTTVFTKRKINIESISASHSEVKGIHRYTISAKTTRELADSVVDQLEKQVDVFKAFVYEEDETVYQEIALYKVPTKEIHDRAEIEQIIREHHARVLTFTPEFVVIEMTGHPEETQELYERFEPYGLFEFVRSGRVAISKSDRNLTSYLHEMENNFSHKKDPNDRRENGYKIW